MSDDRYSYIHASVSSGLQWCDEQEDIQGWDLPDDDIDIPPYLIPTYQDEQDDSVLPSSTHPSYPFGNPYSAKSHFSTSTYGASGSSSMNPSFVSTSNVLPPPSLFHKPILTMSSSLATTLSNLELRHLFETTSFGEPRERKWFEIAPDQVVKGGSAVGIVNGRGWDDEDDQDAVAGGAGGTGSGSRSGGGTRTEAAAGTRDGDDSRDDAPAGQNAGDAPTDEEDGN
ncbi:hypothetical protein OIO90_005634 [Microbotryomycetes sp. JL221]|nr:hypothetical protein OIO90_005634 [Microbotryomycetes sp. JL221]